MAHPTTQLRLLAPPDPDPGSDSPPHKPPSTAPSMAAASAPNSSPLSNHIPFSRLHSHAALSSQRPNNPNPPPAILDSHLQAKPLTVSAMLDSSKFHLVKSKSHPRKIASVGTEKLNKLCKELGTQKFFGEKKEADEGVDGSSGLSLVVKDKELKEFQKGHHLHLGNLRPTVSLLRRGGRRRSFGGSQVELADIFANNGVRVVSVDMPPVMQIHAVDSARKAHDSMEKFTSKTLALSLKRVINLRFVFNLQVFRTNGS